MKFRFNRNTSRVEPIQDIPDQRTKVNRLSGVLGLPTATMPPPALPTPPQINPFADIGDFDLSPGAINYGSFIPTRSLPNGRNRSASSSFYGRSSGTSYLSAGCTCPACNPISWNSVPYSCIPNAGIRAGELVAWRFWCYEPRYERLKSAFMEVIWVPGQPMTGDVRDAGVFSWRDRDFALRECHRWLIPEPFYIFGSIYHWGEVIEHERGYRSERAEIRSLDAIIGYNRSWPDLDHLRKLYGVKP